MKKLTRFTVLFGKNGSGKSRLLRGWRDLDRKTFHYVVPERTGELDYQANFVTQQLSGETRSNESNRNFAIEYRRQIVARIQAYLAARGNYRGGVPPSDPGDIEAALSRLLPDFSIQILGAANPPYTINRASDGQRIGGIDLLSSGEAQLLLLGLDILTVCGMWEVEKVSTRVMLVDEPDAHVHPDLLVRFADFLLDVSKKHDVQFAIATHSTSLLAALGQFGGGDVSTIYMDRRGLNFSAEPFNQTTQTLASILGGHALMGPLFGVPMVLVEGDDDYRIWSQVPRYHVASLSAIPCGGQMIFQYQQELEKILASLRSSGTSPAGFALLDGDKPKPTTASQTHIKFIQLNCHESENLYLTDEVLAVLGTNWVDAQTAIDSEAAKFGQKEQLLRAVVGCDRRKHDLKPVIEQLAQIIDPKKVHWTLRVAAVIGKAKPSGQIGDFLGPEVVAALWQ